MAHFPGLILSRYVYALQTALGPADRWGPATAHRTVGDTGPGRASEVGGCAAPHWADCRWAGLLPPHSLRALAHSTSLQRHHHRHAAGLSPASNPHVTHTRN